MKKSLEEKKIKQERDVWSQPTSRPCTLRSWMLWIPPPTPSASHPDSARAAAALRSSFLPRLSARRHANQAPLERVAAQQTWGQKAFQGAPQRKGDGLGRGRQRDHPVGTRTTQSKSKEDPPSTRVLQRAKKARSACHRQTGCQMIQTSCRAEASELHHHISQLLNPSLGYWGDRNMPTFPQHRENNESQCILLLKS